jgi:hypothetical protein
MDGNTKLKFRVETYLHVMLGEDHDSGELLTEQGTLTESEMCTEL